ncbi:hypothetical protein AALA56_03940 [Streptococcus hyointestinalis]
MGKYQLDYKGQAQVERFHEKQVKGFSNTKKERAQALLKKAGRIK